MTSQRCVPCVKQPCWYPPRPMENLNEYWNKYYPLRLYNSLTRSKDHFVPMSGNRVLLYQCGPTVYDSSHLGHCRTFLCLDIFRRILEDYFQYEVELVMNITDIDDKIIIRAAEEGWKKDNPDECLEDFSKAEGIRKVMEWASHQSVSDNMQRTFALSEFWEKSFFDDMSNLGIKLPTVITRVSEYLNEIIAYIEQIILNGYAYEANGSVYFDTMAFSTSKGKAYGKLVPENVGQSALLAEGEGSLATGATSANVGTLDKRHSNDFALWKKSKRGEVYWKSPWGQGRPGWHIECSAMAGDTLKHIAGGAIDIHAGGIDLRFPHHDNEIAQSEAHFDCCQWVNYFVHTGHLNIQGLKMSKSLKNFVKISEALMDNSPRQLRLLFLLHRYNVPMDYNDNTMDEAVTIERMFNEFFLNIKATLREFPVASIQKWSEPEKALELYILSVKSDIHKALCDDMNTPLCISILQDLVKEVNRYIAGTKVPISMILRSAAEYVTRIFKVFGLIDPQVELGFPLDTTGSGKPQGEEDTLAPILDILCHFRDSVRLGARVGDMSKVLTLCDELRDSILPQQGVRLEDRGQDGQGAVWKLANKADLLEDMRRKEQEKSAKAAEKQAKELLKRQVEAEKATQAKIKPEDLFRSQVPAKYSQFDAQGLPTHDLKGEPVAKAQLKKLKKEQDKQAKLVAKYS